MIIVVGPVTGIWEAIDPSLRYVTEAPDHRPPQLLFAVDELGKLVRRHLPRRGAEILEFLLHVSLRQDRPQVMAQLLHDRSWRPRRGNQHLPSGGNKSGHGLSDCRNIGPPRQALSGRNGKELEAASRRRTAESLHGSCNTTADHVRHRSRHALIMNRCQLGPGPIAKQLNGQMWKIATRR